MREILFRGFTPEDNGYEEVIINGEVIKGRWVMGSYMRLDKTTYCCKEDYPADNAEHYIVFDRMTDWGLPNLHLRADVIPESIGQYTGLNDKNGTKIFEGDIILNKYMLTHSEAKQTKEQRIGVIIYDKCEFRADKYVNGKKDGAFWIKHIWKGDSIEVIGNIHDNPELLEVEE